MDDFSAQIFRDNRDDEINSIIKNIEIIDAQLNVLNLIEKGVSIEKIKEKLIDKRKQENINYSSVLREIYLYFIDK